MFTALPTPTEVEVVATFDDHTRWIAADAERRAFEDRAETREITRLMTERTSVCG